ncbi:MAG: response regulator [Verrucomicrobiota bacterium]
MLVVFVALLFSLVIIASLSLIVLQQKKKLSQLDSAPVEPPVEIVSPPTPAEAEIIGSDALFATLSHELRTPLNGLLGVVQILNEEKEDEDLQAIEGCARHMLAVLSTLVNHTKIKSELEDLPEYREWVSPFELLEQVKKNLDFRAQLRGVRIQLEHQDKTLRLRGDYDHLKNIVENAVLGSLECISLTELPNEQQVFTLAWKSMSGRIHIQIQNPLEQYSDDRWQKIQTADGLTTGENHSRIKMEYLYWAVSNMLLERYNGVMDSQPMEHGGVDTKISFEMKQMQASPSAKLPIGGLSLETKSAPAKAVKELPFQLSILVAEDDPLARSLMAAVLELMGQEAHFATNGQELLDYVSQSTSYDMILMDIDMPIMDGISASRALRNGEVGEFGTTVPIVAVTAFSTLSDESKFKKAGMNYFLPKPVTLKSLREVILDVVRKDPSLGA